LSFYPTVPFLPTQDSFVSKTLTHQKYRADIDGLRAIAVFSVLIFHAFPSLISGGFIGVDIFFIISGYLISTIIIDNLEKDRFSFLEFYSRRIKRIYPALLLVLSLSLLLGWFVLLADEFKQLGKHIAGGAGFISNLVLSHESGYFDSTAETKPFLHLWSLGVEEQFYIVWPLVLWFSWKRRFNFFIIAAVITLLSFTFSNYVLHRNMSDAFYSPLTRFWELVMGSLMAYTGLHKNSLASNIKNKLKQSLNKSRLPFFGEHWENIQSIIGGLLIAFALFYLNKDSTFPGWRALLPTLGACLIIMAGSKAWLNRQLANPLFVGIGLISYPLYLWHWPILSFAHIVNGGTPSVALRCLALVVSLILAWATYQYIEKPVRKGVKGTIKTKVLFGAMLVVGGLGYVTYDYNGFGDRLGEKEAYNEYFENSEPAEHYFHSIGFDKNYRQDCDFYDIKQYRAGHPSELPRANIAGECFKRNPKLAKSVFIWGDSHAQQLYYGLSKNLPADWQILQVTTSGCVANVQDFGKSEGEYCEKSNRFALNTIAKVVPDVVIVAQSEGQTAQEYNEIAAKLKNLQVSKIIFMGPTPHWTADLPRVVARSMWGNIPRRSFTDINQQVVEENSTLQATFKQTKSVVLVDLIHFFCNESGCLVYLGNDTKNGITSWDYGHLTPIASQYLAHNLLVDLIVDKKVTKLNSKSQQTKASSLTAKSLSAII
jgi:peptidoglycan/LPS O-acetylase OafA/YrhL